MSNISSALALIGNTIQARIGIWKCWFLRRAENRSTRRKNFGAEKRTNNKFNPHMTPGPGIEPGTHQWEASALTAHTIAPSVLPYVY